MIKVAIRILDADKRNEMVAWISERGGTVEPEGNPVTIWASMPSYVAQRLNTVGYVDEWIRV